MYTAVPTTIRGDRSTVKQNSCPTVKQQKKQFFSRACVYETLHHHHHRRRHCRLKISYTAEYQWVSQYVLQGEMYLVGINSTNASDVFCFWCTYFELSLSVRVCVSKLISYNPNRGSKPAQKTRSVQCTIVKSMHKIRPRVELCKTTT